MEFVYAHPFISVLLIPVLLAFGVVLIPLAFMALCAVCFGLGIIIEALVSIPGRIKRRQARARANRIRRNIGS